MNREALRRLPANAIATHFALQLLGGQPTVQELAFSRGVSVATIFRALAMLRNAAIHPVLSVGSKKPAKHSLAQKTVMSFNAFLRFAERVFSVPVWCIVAVSSRLDVWLETSKGERP